MLAKLRLFLLVPAMLFAFLSPKAQGVSEGNAEIAAEDAGDKERPVTGSYRIELGRRSVLSTYLSPFSYHGTGFGVSGFWLKALPADPEHLSMHFETRVNYGRLLNPAGSASELDLHANFQWGLDWVKRLPDNWTVNVGGSAGFYGGALYLLRNSNNPVNAQFAIGISADAYVSRLIRIKSLPILISDRINIPLAGGFFCQEYGEPYYEIYLGNRKGLGHFGCPGNRFGIDNLLMVTLDLGRTAMEVGYRFSFQNEQANNLTTRTVCHSLVIGVIPGGLGIKTRRENIITPLY